MNPVISVAELVTLLEWSDPVVLCASMGPNPPTSGIAGSHLADLEADFSDPDNPLPHTVPTELTALFAAYGVSDGTPVVVYDDQDGASAPRVWWLAKVAGINARVLDGGLRAWTQAGHDVAELTAPPGGGRLTATRRPELLRDKAGDRWSPTAVWSSTPAPRVVSPAPNPSPARACAPGTSRAR